MSGSTHILVCCAAVLWAATPETDERGVPSEETTEVTGKRRDVIRDEDPKPIMDFEKRSGGWRVINDVVMGGVSCSQFRIAEGTAVFEGTLSLENNGGFASVRSQPRKHDLAKFHGIRLRVRGDGKRYALRLRTADTFDGISYEAGFETTKGKWSTIDLPFATFQPVYRGRRVPRAEPLNRGSIKTFGFLISDKQEGPFRLEIDWIKSYRPEPE